LIGVLYKLLWSRHSAVYAVADSPAMCLPHSSRSYTLLTKLIV